MAKQGLVLEKTQALSRPGHGAAEFELARALCLKNELRGAQQ